MDEKPKNNIFLIDFTDSFLWYLLIPKTHYYKYRLNIMLEC